MPLGEAFLSQALKVSGYSTHMIGKWNLGHFDERYLPHSRGFDSFLGFMGDQETYYAHRAFGTMHPENRSFCDLMATTASGGVEVGACHVGVYSTDLYTDRLASVIREHATTATTWRLQTCSGRMGRRRQPVTAAWAPWARA